MHASRPSFRNGLDRRSLLGGLGALALARAVRPAGAATPSRVAAVDWAMLETLLALGHPPVAAAELELYARIVVEPPIPAGVADLGLRGSLNFEQLLLSRPDLILSSPFAKWARPQLERIAPVLSLPIYVPGEPPYGKAEAATREVAARLGIAGAGERVVADAAAEIDRIRAALAGRERRPVFIVNVGDPRHVRSFGEDSMFGNVLSRLGFDNAWRRPTSYRATAPVGLEALAEVPEARIVVVGPVPPDARRVLPQSALWKALPAVAGGRATFLPPVDAFGALPAALRFARLFAASLEASSNG